MTRTHYIKKIKYFRYRLAQLPTSPKELRRDTYLSNWRTNTPTLPMRDENGKVTYSTYEEAWNRIVEAARTIEGLEDLA